MAIAIILAHVSFITGYIFYISQFLSNNSGNLIYPVYMAPFIIYILFFCFSFLAKKAAGGNIISNFKLFSPALFIFVLLFMTPYLLKTNLPDPHNFVLRKLEIMLGSIFAMYIFILTVILFFIIKNKYETKESDIKKTFIYIASFFFVFYFSISLWFNYANQPTGDEPAYILTTHSMIHDGDINLKNNYENKDYKAFYDRELVPQNSDMIKGDKIYTYHPVFLSLVITPFYFLAGRLGATIFMNACTALLIAFLFYLLFRIFENMKTAVITASITGFSMPLLGLTNSIATDGISGLLLIAAYVIIKCHKEKTIYLSLIMACTVWMHLRVAPVYAGLSLLYILNNRKEIKQIIIFCLIQLLSAAGFFVFNIIHYGSIMPSYMGPGSNESALFSNNFFIGLITYFIDRQLGLFAYAPVFIFIFAGLFYICKKNIKLIGEMLLIGVPYLIVICTVIDSGGGSASPRYLAPIIFLFAIPLAAAINEIKTELSKMIFSILAYLGFIMSLIICMIPWFRWDKPAHENAIFSIFSKYSHLNLSSFFPSFSLTDKTTYISASFWIMTIIIVNIYFIITNSTKGKKI